MRRVDREVTYIDFLLGLVNVLLVSIIGGASIGQNEISYFFVPIALVTSVLGYLLARFAKGRSIESLDWLFYFITGISVVLGVAQLNKVLPGEGFPFQLIAMSYLTWMMVLGQLVAWRDVTICFQAVPAIAAFGLVGAFDYYLTPYFFFAFLVAISGLFFRMHARGMLKRAEASFAISDEMEEMRDPKKLFEHAFETGAWRWMAGTEWAIASALGIVLLSFLGAPVIRSSVKGFSGLVSFNLPTAAAKVLPPGSGSNRSGDLSLGRGPLLQTGTPLMKVQCDGTLYWHTQSYDIYRGQGWDSSFRNPRNWPEDARKAELVELHPNFVQKPFSVELQFSAEETLPVPGIAYQINAGTSVLTHAPDGNIIIRERLQSKTYSGLSLFPPANVVPIRATIPAGYEDTKVADQQRLTMGMRRIVTDAMGNAKSDWEIAQRIKKFISNRCNYNLKAPAVPAGQDAVDFFLFESKEGYCDLFASSMAMLARAAGLPARLSAGYLVTSSEKDKDGFTQVTDKDAHVWCEIYFPERGWEVFDATEGAVDVTGRESVEAARKRELLNLALNIGTVIVIVAGISGLAFALLRERKQAASEPSKSKVGKIYSTFVANLERFTRKPRRLSETPREYSQRIAPLIGASHQSVSELTEVLSEAIYSGKELSDTEVSALRQRVKTVSAALRKNSK
ncbi:MAG: transglutaminaseTgpA domain-containing protein [Armatimonadetes bacterium]|nr:transglutaminaseTgpA domain-containing protein [Armatimonadota bacterium]